MKTLQVLGCLVAVAAAGFVAAPRAAGAADAMASPAAMMMDCANAKSMMMKMTPAPMAMKPDASADRVFVDMMVQHDKMAMAMAKMESKCGKDPKTRAMAAKMADSLQVDISQLLLMTFP